VIVLSVIGFATWMVTTKIPMDPAVRTAIQLLVFIVILLYILRRLDVLPNVL
jgi:hypothetical protein